MGTEEQQPESPRKVTSLIVEDRPLQQAETTPVLPTVKPVKKIYEKLLIADDVLPEDRELIENTEPMSEHFMLKKAKHPTAGAGGNIKFASIKSVKTPEGFIRDRSGKLLAKKGML